MSPKSDILKKLEFLSRFSETENKHDENLQNSVDESINGLQSTLQENDENASSKDCISSWKFVSQSLECLLSLKNNLREQSEESEKLLSVAQQRSIRTLLDRITNLALLPNLLPGVDPLPQRTGPNRPTSTLSDFKKYEQLCVVVSALLELCYDDTFHGVVLPQFLNPIMCALCQLTMVPLKKSGDTYAQLQRERLVYQQQLQQLVTKLYQPMVIKELMVIEGNKKSAKWLKRGVGRLLTDLLHRPRGVAAVVEAVRDAASSSAPTSLAHLESVALVISASPDLDNICPQILELLDSSDAEMVRVAVLCVRALHKREPSVCDSRLLQPMTKPLSSTACSEQALSLCLQRLHKCFAVPASDFWCLPSQLLQPHIHALFLLYCKVYQSAVHLRRTVEDLVWCFLSKCEETVLTSVFHCLIYQEEVSGITIANKIEFVFGDDGGVRIVPSEESESSLEEYGDALMILFERRDTKGSIGNRLFVNLLKFATEDKSVDSIQALERKLVTVKLLAVLSENEAVQKSLSENPAAVVEFLKSMIDSFSSDQSNEIETISIALVVLNVILNDFVHSKKGGWQIFCQLEQPLALLKSNAKSKELRLLAEEAHEVIMTHTAVKSTQNSSCFSKENNSRGSDKPTKPMSSCEEALREACDPLLPIRGHAIMQLGKLVAAGDKQAQAKKDQILCIFQENLKHEDSFLYLSAIDGLATVAAEFPDSVILSLTEQYGRRSLSSETRLKVGEAIVRVVRLLGELVPVYKAELINAFLTGTKDDDFLVRASSLSNLAELCRLLGFRVGPIVTEVLMCARCVICSDPSVEVRRSAVMLISLLLKGLHKDTFTVLEDVLLELYHSLKQIYSSDKDDVTRLHAQLALEELNSNTLAFLFPTPQLSKQIFLLDPPQ